MISITKRRYYPWTCWALAAIVYFLQYGLMVFPSAIPADVKTSMSISSTQLGVFSASFLYTFVFMQIPAGLMFDHFGSKNLLFYSTLLIALGCVVLGVTHGYTAGIISRLLMGVGGSFSFVGAVYLARTWFPVAMFPVLVGITEALSGLGEIGLPAMFAAIRFAQSWRFLLLEIGIITVVIAFLIKMHVRDRKSVSVKHHVSIRKDLFRTIKSKNLWLLGLFAGFINAHFMAMADMWGVLFLRHRYNISVTKAIIENAFAILGYTIGCCVIGYLVKYVSSRRLVFVFSLIVFLSHMIITFYFINIYVESVVLLVIGFATSSAVLSYDLAEKIVPSTAYGMAAGFITMFLSLIGTLLVPFIGYLSNLLEYDIYLATFPGLVCTAVAVILGLRICLSEDFAFSDRLSKL